jgi:hypothetical protein
MERPPAVATTSTSGSFASAATVGPTSRLKLWLATVPLRHQHDISRTVEFVRPGWRRDRVGNDRRRADEMHQARNVACKFEARHRQLLARSAAMPQTPPAAACSRRRSMAVATSD